jgi:hypothetical protein
MRNSVAMRLKKLRLVAATTRMKPRTDDGDNAHLLSSTSSLFSKSEKPDIISANELKPAVPSVTGFSEVSSANQKFESSGEDTKCHVMSGEVVVNDDGSKRRNDGTTLSVTDDVFSQKDIKSELVDDAEAVEMKRQPLLKPSPSRVSVAVQTDAYDSEDDDDTSSSSCASSDDDMSDSDSVSGSDISSHCSIDDDMQTGERPSSVAACDTAITADSEQTCVQDGERHGGVIGPVWPPDSPGTAADTDTDDDDVDEAHPRVVDDQHSLPSVHSPLLPVETQNDDMTHSMAAIVSTVCSAPQQKFSSAADLESTSDCQQVSFSAISGLDSPLSVSSSSCSDGVSGAGGQDGFTDRIGPFASTTEHSPHHVPSSTPVYHQHQHHRHHPVPQQQLCCANIDGYDSQTVMPLSVIDGSSVPHHMQHVAGRSSVSVLGRSMDFAAATVSDMLSMSSEQMSFKMPVTGSQSPDDGHYATESYHVGYSSSPSTYGISSSECSPVCAAQLAQQTVGAFGSLINGVGYSMPTPSPTNSSSRSFNMASPSAYQQPPSVPPGCQMETGASLSSSVVVYPQEAPPSGSGNYQPSTSMPSVGIYQHQSAVVESFVPSVAASSYRHHHHMTVTPPMGERTVNRNCPSAPVVGYMPAAVSHQRQQPYPVGVPNGGAANMSAPWSHLCGHQQNDVSSMEFVPHEMVPLQMAPQPTPPQLTKSTVVTCRSTHDKQLHRRCGKSCNKDMAVQSVGLRGSQQHQTGAAPAPNVTIQPGTNMITSYNMYDTSIGGTLSNHAMPCTTLGYASGSSHYPPSLDYPSSYIVDPRRHTMAPAAVASQMDIYRQHRQQQVPAPRDVNFAPSYPSSDALQQHGAMYTSSVPYGFMNGAGQQSAFGMNIMHR